MLGLHAHRLDLRVRHLVKSPNFRCIQSTTVSAIDTTFNVIGLGNQPYHHEQPSLTPAESEMTSLWWSRCVCCVYLGNRYSSLRRELGCGNDTAADIYARGIRRTSVFSTPSNPIQLFLGWVNMKICKLQNDLQCKLLAKEIQSPINTMHW